MMPRFERFTHLTFDCYGTLIDWENGILDALRPILEQHGVDVEEGELLRLYARHEARQEAGSFRIYRKVLRGVMAGLADDLGFIPSPTDLEALPASVGSWRPFADTAEALERLARRYRLAIVSNVDDDLFAETARHLPVDFDPVVTAQEVGAYKPSPQNFRVVLERLGVPRHQVLHVAQSLFHDHVPAKRLGLTTVWINRPSRCPGTGLSLPVVVAPDLELPDLESLARATGL